MMHNINNLHMYVKGLMSKQVIKCKSNDNLIQISKTLLRNKTDSLIVTDGKVDVGIITVNNIMAYLVKNDIKPAAIKARDLMTSPIIYVYEDDELIDAIKKLERYNISRLLVKNRKNQDMGVITNADLISRICIISITYRKKEYAHNKKNSADFEIKKIIEKTKRIDISKSIKKVIKNLRTIDNNVVVIQENKKDLGIISKKDILEKICLKNKKITELEIKDVVRKKFTKIDINTPYVAALLLFLLKQIDIVIVEKNSKIIGSLSINDFLKRSTANHKRANKVLKKGGYAKSIILQAHNPAIKHKIIFTKVYHSK